MVAKLTVILFIMVCLQVGILLTLLPWFNFGPVGDWGNNPLLALAVDKTGLPIIKTTVASAWFRGGVTGLGIFNLLIGFWEIANFNKSVKLLEGKEKQEKE